MNKYLFILSFIICCCSYNSFLTFTSNIEHNPYISEKIRVKVNTHNVYFIIKYIPENQTYFLILSYIGKQSTLLSSRFYELKFLVDNFNIVTLSPISNGNIVAYRHDELVEYVLTYPITESQLYSIAYASTVSMQLLSSNNLIWGNFTKFSSFDPMRKFIYKVRANIMKNIPDTAKITS